MTSLLNKDVGRHVKRDETCAVKGVGPKCSTLKPSSLVSVTACRDNVAVCQGLKVFSPDIVAPQRHPNLYRHRGYCAEGIPLPRVLCRWSYRTFRNSGYGYGYLAELTEVPGTGTKPSQNPQKFRAGTKTLYRHPGYFETGRTELTEVPGTGMKVVQNKQKFWVRVKMSYRTYRSFM